MSRSGRRPASVLIFVLALFAALLTLALADPIWASPGAQGTIPTPTRKPTRTMTRKPTRTPTQTPIGAVAPQGTPAPDSIPAPEQVELVAAGDDSVPSASVQDVSGDSLHCTTPDDSNYALIGHCAQVSAVGTEGQAASQFAKPVELRLPVTNTDLNLAGGDAQSLAVLVFDPALGTWRHDPRVQWQLDATGRWLRVLMPYSGLIALFTSNGAPRTLPATGDDLLPAWRWVAGLALLGFALFLVLALGLLRWRRRGASGKRRVSLLILAVMLTGASLVLLAVAALAFVNLTPSAPPVVPAQVNAETAGLTIEAVMGEPRGTLAEGSRILIPSLSLDAPLVGMTWEVKQRGGERVSEWLVPNDAVGRAINSANPGEQGNVVVSAHNNRHSALFRQLYQLKPGDEITLFNEVDEQFTYRVTRSYIVPDQGQTQEERLAAGRVMEQTEDAQLTLISCWPPQSNTHRAIVVATLVGPSESAAEEEH